MSKPSIFISTVGYFVCRPAWYIWSYQILCSVLRSFPMFLHLIGITCSPASASELLHSCFKLRYWTYRGHWHTIGRCHLSKFKCRGKRDFKETQKSDADLSFSRAEAQKIMMYAITHPDYKTFAVAIMFSTGLRAEELLGLETQDAELILQKAVAFREQDQSHSPFLLLNKHSEAGKLHLRALDNHLRDFIHYDVLKLSKKWNARSAHDRRHTYASLEYLAGTDIRTIKMQMGHNSEAQTWDCIKEVIDVEERKNRLRGGNILSEIA